MAKAKFRVHAVTAYRSGLKEVTLEAVMGPWPRNPAAPPEGDLCTRVVPNGEIRIQVDNPTAAAMFSPGAELFVEFSPAPLTVG